MRCCRRYAAAGQVRSKARYSRGKKGGLTGEGAALGTRACDDAVMRVLVVEDDPAVAEPLLEGLRRNGFETEHVVYASQVLPAVMSSAGVDVVLLDIGLPDGDGLEVLRELRRTSDIPVIIATARGDETDRIVGLGLGADDYVVIPFACASSRLGCELSGARAASRRQSSPGVSSSIGAGMTPSSTARRSS